MERADDGHIRYRCADPGEEGLIKYDNVLIGVKGDTDDHRAIALAHRLAGPGARLTLVHVSSVWAQQESERGALLGLPIRSPADLTSAFADQLGLAGESARLIREYGTSVGAGLQATATRLSGDLLVLGSTRHRGLERVLRGDDVESAVTGASCALAVADVGPTTGRRPPATIGVAYDGTPESTAAFVFGSMSLSLSHNARCPLIIAPPPAPTPDSTQPVETFCAQAAPSGA